MPDLNPNMPELNPNMPNPNMANMGNMRHVKCIIHQATAIGCIRQRFTKINLMKSIYNWTPDTRHQTTYNPKLCLTLICFIEDPNMPILNFFFSLKSPKY